MQSSKENKQTQNQITSSPPSPSSPPVTPEKRPEDEALILQKKTELQMAPKKNVNIKKSKITIVKAKKPHTPYAHLCNKIKFEGGELVQSPKKSNPQKKKKTPLGIYSDTEDNESEKEKEKSTSPISYGKFKSPIPHLDYENEIQTESDSENETQTDIEKQYGDNLGNLLSFYANKGNCLPSDMQVYSHLLTKNIDALEALKRSKTVDQKVMDAITSNLKLTMQLLGKIAKLTKYNLDLMENHS